MLEKNHTNVDNVTNISPSNLTNDDDFALYPIEWVIPITVVYAIIFVSGIIGNISTCIVIAQNKSLRTVTNYYLFSIAISDLLLLISGLPPEMYRIWSPESYVFGQTFCVLQGFAAETSANATVLTITAFTVERYLAICHPFLSHTMANLSRAVKYIIFIWIVALCLAAPQASQFGVQYEFRNGTEVSRCTVVTSGFFAHAFEISTFVIFVGPMTLITVLYIQIAVKLGKSKVLHAKRSSLGSYANNDGVPRTSRSAAAQNRVIKMLVAVVVAFFICWAPFHAQRLLAVYLQNATREAQDMLISIYIALMYISGVLYFLSTTVNPVLYHIMSNRFREAFKNTFYKLCGRSREPEIPTRAYSALSRCPPSLRNYQRSVSDGVQVQACQEIPLNQECTVTETNNTREYLQLLQSRQKFRPRMLSQSSQTTVLSTISESRNVNGRSKIEKAKGLNAQIISEEGQKKNEEKNKKHLRGLSSIFRLFHKQNKRNDSICLRHCSVGSANTISNSSLKDMEEIEFSSTDLVRYMEEVNDDLT